MAATEISDAAGSVNPTASEQTTQQETEKGKSMTTVTPPTHEQQKPFEGDRYERLRQAAEVLATDENIAAAEPPFDSEGIRVFASTIQQLELFTGLSDDDANSAGMLLLLDFPRGPQQMGWRVGNLLSEHPDVSHEYDDETAVIATYVEVLGMLLTAFRGPDPHRMLTRLAADTYEAYDTLKLAPGNAGDYLLAARDSIADAIGVLR